jgi:hypothetical protein
MAILVASDPDPVRIIRIRTQPKGSAKLATGTYLYCGTALFYTAPAPILRLRL